MFNPNLLIFLGNDQWKLAKQMNNDFYSIFHSTNVTAKLFENLEMLQEFIWKSIFPQFWYD